MTYPLTDTPELLDALDEWIEQEEESNHEQII